MESDFSLRENICSIAFSFGPKHSLNGGRAEILERAAVKSKNIQILRSWAENFLRHCLSVLSSLSEAELTLESWQLLYLTHSVAEACKNK